MKVECPNCHTKYNLPDDKVGAEGANVRCSVCRHEFHVEAPAADDFPGFGESGASPIWPVQAEGEDAFGGFESQLDAARKKDPFDDAGVSSSDFASIDFGKPAKEKGETSKSKKIILAACLGFTLLLGISGAAAYFFEFWPFAKPGPAVQTPASGAGEQASSVMENAQGTPGQPAKEQGPDYSAQLQFESFTNHVVENEKLGKVLVIEGKLVNRSPVAVGEIAIEVTLLDAKETALETKVFMAGPKASFFDLRTMDKEALDSRLNSKQEILLNNSNVKPGEEVPFMVAFQGFPPTVANYSLKLKGFREVQAPPQPAAKK
ncbi:DUF3426 domain-containing protein [Fundidesulfovibrio putealis]|uniref:DUF3426 domain-containing protein n=1 Tax=Fundidesulfovibrio putealis TaxID=270496 RepID=UPI00040FA0D7|nr:DUF3426 domain-containing protein [Fundidesulfovibrio putealis]